VALILSILIVQSVLLACQVYGLCKQQKKALQSELYRHFKGGLYLLDGPGVHTETNEQLIFYRNEDGLRFVRPFHMWNEEVSPGVRRFTLIGVR